MISSLNKVTHFIHQSILLMPFFITEVILPCNAITGSKDPPDGLCLIPCCILCVLQSQAHSRCSNPSLRKIGEPVHEAGVFVVGRVENGRQRYGWVLAIGRRWQGEGLVAYVGWTSVCA